MPITVSRPPQNPTRRQPYFSHKADVNGANRNMFPKANELTQPKKEKFHNNNFSIGCRIHIGLRLGNFSEFTTILHITAWPVVDVAGNLFET